MVGKPFDGRANFSHINTLWLAQVSKFGKGETTKA